MSSSQTPSKNLSQLINIQRVSGKCSSANKTLISIPCSLSCKVQAPSVGSRQKVVRTMDQRGPLIHNNILTGKHRPTCSICITLSYELVHSSCGCLPGLAQDKAGLLTSSTEWRKVHKIQFLTEKLRIIDGFSGRKSQLSSRVQPLVGQL